MFATREEIVEQLKRAVKDRGLKYLIAIPTYNEVDNTPELIRRIIKHVKADREIVVIDDSSPDGTGEAVLELAKTHPGIQVYRRMGKLGLGSAYKAAFALAIDAGVPFVITI